MSVCAFRAAALAGQPPGALDHAVKILNDWNTSATDRAEATATIRNAGTASWAHIRKLLQSTNWAARMDGLTLAAQTNLPDLIEATIAALSDKNWAVRAHAAALAGEVPAEQRTALEPAIKALLGDPIGNVRLAAYKVLVSWRPDDGHISNALSDADTEVSYWAAQQYMNRAESGTLTPEVRARLAESIIAKLRSNQWREADSRSIATLLTLGSTAQDALYGAILSAPPNLRTQAVSTIGSRAGKAAADLLFRLMDTPDLNLQRAAISLLHGTCEQRHGPRLLEIMRTATDPEIRQYALQALGRIQYKEALPHVLKLIEQRDRNVMSPALSVVATMGDKSILPRLLELYETEPEGYMRSQWVNPIAQLLKHEAADFLRDAVRDDHQAVRQAAVYAVRSFLKEKDKVDILIRVIQDDDNDYVRYTAISNLGQEQVERALDALIEALREGGPQARRAAASRLGQAKSLRAVQALIDAYAQEDTPDIRSTLIAALGNVRDNRAAPILRKALASNDPQMRSAALRALSNFPDIVGHGLLVGLLQKEQDDTVLGTCVNIINARNIILPECLPQFARMMESPDNGLRYAVVTAVSRIESVPAVQLLCRVVQQDADSSVRALAVNALVAQLSTRRITPQAVQKDVIVALETSDESARQRILGALSELRDRSLATVFLGVLKRDTSDEVRRQAALALRQVAGKEIAPELVEAAKTEENPANLVILIGLLGDIGDRQTLPFLKDSLRSQEPSVQAAALRAVGAFKDASLIPFYVERFKDSTSNEVRLNSLRALRGAGDRRALEALLGAIADEDPLIRQAAVDVLTEFRDAEVAAALVSRVTDENNPIEPTEIVLKVLSETRLRSSGPALLTAARRTTQPARLKGFCDALGALRDRRAVPFFVELIRTHSTPEVVEAALRAISHAGSRSDAALCLDFARKATGRLARIAAAAAGQLGATNEVAEFAAQRFESGSEAEKRFFASFLAVSESEDARAMLRRALAVLDNSPLLVSVCSHLRANSPMDTASLEAIALADVHPRVAVAAVRALVTADTASARATLARILASSRPAVVRAAALTAHVARVGGPGARDVLVRCLSSPEPELRVAALQALHQARDLDEEVIHHVIAWARQDDDSIACIEAIHALGGAHGSKAAEETLMGLIRAPERGSGIRDVIRSLGQLRAAAAVPLLVELATSSEVTIRVLAVEALGQIGTEPARIGVEEAFEQEDIDQLRAAAALALGRTGNRGYVVRLARALQSAPGLDVRAACATALGNLGGDQAQVALVEALRQESGAVRESALRALAKMRARTAVNDVKRLLDDSDAGVVAAALECVARLSERGEQ